MLDIALGAVSVTLLGTAFVIGFRLGMRKGVEQGRTDMVRRLLRIKNPESWNAAHYVEIDLISEAETERQPVVKPAPRRAPAGDRAAPLER